MWWEDDGDRSVARFLDRLEESGRGEHLLGYGATAGGAPWIVVRAELDPRPERWCPGPGISRDIVRRLIARWRPIPPQPKRYYDYGSRSGDSLAEREELRPRPPIVWVLWQWIVALRRARRERNDLAAKGCIVTYFQADDQTRSLLDDLDVPLTTKVSYWVGATFTRAPCTVVAPPAGMRATPGFVITTIDDTLVTSVGHLGADEGREIVMFEKRRWRQRIRVRGRVLMRLVAPMAGAATTGAIDLTVITVDNPHAVRRSRPVTTVKPYEVRDFQRFDWYGSRSHLVNQMVLGSLRSLEVDGVRLANCWSLVGGSAPGDSGAAVFSDDGDRVLGHVVATEGRMQKTGQREATVVQDAELLVSTASTMSGLPVVSLWQLEFD